MSHVKEIPPQELRKMQLLQFDMLVEMDRVCRANGIPYTISNGTLLGAIRHKGYIPWDDDADTMMLRQDYEKFKQCADQLNPDICFFQDHSTDPEYRWGYGKLRRTGTEYIRAGQEHMKNKTGLFIDVFPMDDIPKSSLGQACMVFLSYCMRKITYSEVGRMNTTGFWRCWYSALSKIPLRFVFGVLGIYAKRSSDDSENRVTTLCMPIRRRVDPYSGEKVYGRPKKWMLERAEYDFEGQKLFGPKDYDKCLSWQYGKNYMTPPPESQRGQHAPVSDYSFGEAKPVYTPSMQEGE